MKIILFCNMSARSPVYTSYKCFEVLLWGSKKQFLRNVVIFRKTVIFTVTTARTSNLTQNIIHWKCMRDFYVGYLMTLTEVRLYSVDGRMINKLRSSRWNENWQRKRKYSEKTCRGVDLFAINSIWHDLGLNPGCRGGNPETYRLEYLRTRRWTEYLDLRERKWAEDGENYTIKNL
jgi:hypothetical protein